MSVALNALPVSACTQTELLALATLQNIEKGLQKTWSKETAILALLQQYAHVSPWTGPISNMSFTLQTDRSTVMTSVSCKDPFPIPRKRHGQRVGVSPKLYVDGIDSCVLDELENQGPGMLFNNLTEEMDNFKRDSMAALSYVVLYGDGTDAPKHMDTSDIMPEALSIFNGPALETTFQNGTGHGLLSILGDDTLRPEYLTLSGADDGCEFWRAGIYNATELSQLDPSDPDYWSGELNFEKIIEWTHHRKTPQSKYVAITDQITYLKIKMSAIRHGMAVDSFNPVSGGTYNPIPDFDTIKIGQVTFVEDPMWPADSIGVFDFNEIYFRPIPSYWMKNTGWQSAFNTPLQKYLWEMWMFGIYTKRRSAHLLICNPTIVDYCRPVSICNTDELAAAIAG